jgi:hypothetical protein
MRIAFIAAALWFLAPALAGAEPAAQSVGQTPMAGVWSCVTAASRGVAHTWLYQRASDGSTLVSDRPSLLAPLREATGSDPRSLSSRLGSDSVNSSHYANARPWITLSPRESARLTYKLLTTDSIQLQSDGSSWWNGTFTCSRL